MGYQGLRAAVGDQQGAGTVVLKYVLPVTARVDIITVQVVVAFVVCTVWPVLRTSLASEVC